MKSENKCFLKMFLVLKNEKFESISTSKLANVFEIMFLCKILNSATTTRHI